VQRKRHGDRDKEEEARMRKKVTVTNIPKSLSLVFLSISVAACDTVQGVAGVAEASVLPLLIESVFRLQARRTAGCTRRQ
jgi:predicted small secreted protein